MTPMPAFPTRFYASSCATVVAVAGLLAPPAFGAPPSLPSDTIAALQRAHVPVSALAVVLQEAGSDKNVLALNDDAAMNPASLAKLLTTFAALDRLGPAWRWKTPVWLHGAISDGTLDGDVVIRGSGDPTLVVERVWLLLQRIQQSGVRQIRGDFVLDGSAFAAAPGDAADFDGEPARPYNVRADALMLNFKAVVHTITPDPAARRARITSTPALAGTPVEQSVPLTDGACGDWRDDLKASREGSAPMRFGGSFAASCGERIWPIADPDPQNYNARLIAGLWVAMGGRLGGRVRDGSAPTDQPPSFEFESPPLAEVVRDINKYSNNTMAQQLFYTLAANAAPSVPASADAARAWLRDWARLRLRDLAPEVSIDNGSGLSRQTRISARALARLLQQAWASAVMPELMSSLPVAGLDGTLRRARLDSARAHLKTGSLRDSVGVAGYVLGNSGRRYVLVAIVNHPNANAARPALEALVRAATDDSGRARGR